VIDDAMRRHLQTERALRAGHVTELPEALLTQPGFPNVDEPYTGTPLMALAISWAPTAVVADLVGEGGDVNFEAADGFPALLGAAMSGREDRVEVVRVLVDAGADLERRGINGWTALHAAASQNDADLVRVLLEAGASRTTRTGVDDDATPLEEAERAGALRAAELLRD
jgi:ankyrin repeat protein